MVKDAIEDLYQFRKYRKGVYRRLENAARQSTDKEKAKEADKALEGAARSLKRENIELIAVAHIVARAAQEQQIHESIVSESKTSVYREQEAKREYARLIERLKNKFWRELNRLDVSFNFNKDDILNSLKPEERLQRLFRSPALGRWAKARSHKEIALIRKKRWTKSDSDNQPVVYLNNFCLRMISIYEEKNIPLNKKHITIIADLINAFSLSPNKQTYRTIFNRISNLSR